MKNVSGFRVFSGCVTIYGVFQRVFICLMKEYLTLHFQMCTVCKVFSKEVKAINCLTEMFFDRRRTRYKVYFHILLEILNIQVDCEKLVKSVYCQQVVKCDISMKVLRRTHTWKVPGEVRPFT